MQNNIISEVVCDSCRGLFVGQRKRYYCEHCKTYHHICKTCGNNHPKCSNCGVPLKKKMEPIQYNNRLNYSYR